jgi:Uma2 family endonuclease
MSTVPELVQPPAGLTYGEPVWEIARLYPPQGYWTEREYLNFDTERLVEFSDGFIEFLPMPTLNHQFILQALFEALKAFVKSRGLGKVVTAGYKLRLREGKYRQPDLIFVWSDHVSRMGQDFTDVADLVMEIVSGSDTDRHRDLVEKRAEYARAGIPQYWIVDPEEGWITVLALDGDKYVEHGIFARGDRATSRLLPGIEVDVTSVLDANE